MNDSFLIEPSIRYRNSFEDYVKSYEKINDKHYLSKYRKALVDFQAYLNDCQDLAKGNALGQNKKTSTYWLIDQDAVVGVVRIRHQADRFGGHIGYDIGPEYRRRGYGSRILELALETVTELDLDEVIVTCEINNNASIKIIEKHQGKLLGTIFDEADNEHLYEYVITVTKR